MSGTNLPAEIFIERKGYMTNFPIGKAKLFPPWRQFTTSLFLYIYIAHGYSKHYLSNHNLTRSLFFLLSSTDSNLIEQ